MRFFSQYSLKAFTIKVLLESRGGWFMFFIVVKSKIDATRQIHQEKSQCQHPGQIKFDWLNIHGRCRIAKPEMPGKESFNLCLDQPVI